MLSQASTLDGLDISSVLSVLNPAAMWAFACESMTGWALATDYREQSVLSQYCSCLLVEIPLRAQPVGQERQLISQSGGSSGLRALYQARITP